MSETEEVELFYGVYLLYSLNPNFLGKMYVGFTVNPNRRIAQHNKGKEFGGASKTNNKGPWKMVLIVHGFPNDISALQFEWAWQHPTISKRLKHLRIKKLRGNLYDYHLRVLSEMLQISPWNRLPLIIRWFDTEFARDSIGYKIPPLHMPICYGPVITKKLLKPDELGANLTDTDEDSYNRCVLCDKPIEPSKELKCLFSDCVLVSHIICLSKSFLTTGEYVPVQGNCPKCGRTCTWGEIIRKYHGCYSKNKDENLI